MVICKINSFIGLVFYAVIYWSLWFECKKNPSETHDRLIILHLWQFNNDCSLLNSL